MTGRKPNQDRLDAIACGSITYTGNPCRNCKNTTKYVNGSTCTFCAARQPKKRIGPKKTSKVFDAVAYQQREANKKKVEGRLRRKYNITLEIYNQMRVDQQFCCITCGRSESELANRGIGQDVLHVDHCHKSNKVRGLLCSDCNTALGKVRENTNTLTKMIAYIDNS